MATIIKPDSPQYPSGVELRDVAYRLSDMDSQAADYLHRVRAEAIKIIEEARQEAASVRDQAQQAGRKAAEQAVERILEDKVSVRMTTLLPALQGAVAKIEDARQDWLRHWESVGIALSIRIAERIVRSELTKRPEISRAWMVEALQLAAGSGNITLRIHPGDYETLGGQVERLAATFLPLATAHLVPDDAISPGGCRVETAFGSIDTRLETQLDRIEQELNS